MEPTNDRAAIRRRLDRVVNRLVSRGVWAPLKAEGFRRAGRRFLRDRDGFCWVAEIQRHTLPSPGETYLSPYFGIWVYGFNSVLFGESGPEKISAGGCYLDKNLYHFATDQGQGIIDVSADLSPEQVDALADNLAKRIRRSGLPWLAQFRTLDDFADALLAKVDRAIKDQAYVHTEIDHAYRCAATVHYLAGHDAISLSYLDRALAEAPLSKRRDTLVPFCDRLRKMIVTRSRARDTGLRA